jgi:hypothetical protein
VFFVYCAETQADLIQDPLRSIEIHVLKRKVDELKRLSEFLEDGAIEVACLSDGSGGWGNCGHEILLWG